MRQALLHVGIDLDAEAKAIEAEAKKVPASMEPNTIESHDHFHRGLLLRLMLDFIEASEAND